MTDQAAAGTPALGFHVITLFPEMIEQAARFGVVGQAIKEGKIALSTLTPRTFTSNVHQTIDDRPFGGGDGMVMMAEPTALAIEATLAGISEPSEKRVIHLSPRGEKLSDRKVRELGGYKDLILIASRYGGIDQRCLNRLVDEEISIGDYVLSGGELGALILIDAVSRVLPGVLGNEASPEDESFSGEFGLLEYPQFTRPREWRSEEVPDALLSGNHAAIEVWKNALSLLLTLERRPDLITTETRVKLGEKRLKEISKILNDLTPEESRRCGISDLEQVRKRFMSFKESVR